MLRRVQMTKQRCPRASRRRGVDATAEGKARGGVVFGLSDPSEYAELFPEFAEHSPVPQFREQAALT